MDWIKKQAQKLLLEPVKREIVRGIEKLQDKVDEGYEIKAKDIDSLLILVRIPRQLGSFITPLIVGLNLRDLVGQKNIEIVHAQLERSIRDVKGWRL